ncbi:MAG TPA: ATP-binding cassette domain-containing protein [Clostridia bacterium]|mgnify:CR=1 FL=1|nr:ATP-binding cassette domain-containing protein [Clostridia bacterium]HPQ46527.1 ATP-binding cassette domain-containing protein [Clostridia bacterium]
MAAIKLDGLSKTYKVKVRGEGLKNTFKSLVKPEYKEVEAVKNVSFSVDEGEMLAFIGPNGAGKSTTIKMLTGILHPTAGQAEVLGFNPVKDRKKLSYQIGAVFGQKSQLSFHLPPLDSFRLLSSVYEIEKTEYEKRLARLTELLELEEFLDSPVRKLSLGQRVRCEFAASLLHGPRILFLDEPTIGLDVVVKHKIRDLIKRLNKEEGVTVFLTSHDAGDIENLCRRAIVIDHGTVAVDMSVKKMKYDYLNKKVVSLKFNAETTLEETEGVTLIKHTPYAAKFSVDTRIAAIGRVIAGLDSDNIADITIEEPPMEEIIAAIYTKK